MIAKSIILHVDANEVVQSRCGKAENARNFFGMEKIRGLIPMDPHAAEVIAKEIVERIPREKA